MSPRKIAALGNGFNNVRISIELNRLKNAELGRLEFVERERNGDVGRRVCGQRNEAIEAGYGNLQLVKPPDRILERSHS